MTKRSERWWFGVAVGALLVTGGAASYLTTGLGGASTVGFDGAESSPVYSSAGFTLVDAAGSPPAAHAFDGGESVAWKVTPSDLGLSGIEFVVANDRAWVVTGADQAGERLLVGVDAHTGRALWRRTVDIAMNNPLNCAPEPLDASAVCIFGFGHFSGIPTATIETIDLASGRSTKTVDLSDLDLPNEEYLDQLHVYDGSIVVRSVAAPATAGTVSRIAGDLSSTLWRTQFDQLCEGGNGWPEVARRTGNIVVFSNAEATTALNFTTGALIANPQCATLDTYGRDGIYGDTSEGRSTSFSVSKDDAVTSVTADLDSRAVDFSTSARPSPLPLFELPSDNEADLALTAAAITTNGSRLWASEIIDTTREFRGGFFGAWDGSHLILVDAAGHVTSVDPKSGKTLWANSYPPPARGESEAGATKPRPMFASDGTLIVADDDSDEGGRGESFVLAFDPDTGAQLWRQSGARVAAVADIGNTPALALETGNIVDGRGLEALVPRHAPETDNAAAQMPSGLPSCPSGMSPISWSTFPDGHVLLCSGSKSLRVNYSRNGLQVDCSSVKFRGASFVLSCAGHETVTIVGRGAVLVITRGASSVTQAATDAWSAWGGATSAGFGASATSVKQSCPPNSVLLSLSTWHGGWLLTCGTDALSVTSFAYLDESTSGSGAAMTYADGQFCGKNDGGVDVCVSAAPALVTFTSSGSTAVQRSVSSNYFASRGVGGTGKGAGAYDVPAPEDTAADQVRYMVQILQKSQVGRAKVSVLIPHLLKCQVTTDDVALATQIVRNRQELVTALQSTPFDQVPDGSRFLAEISEALSVSLQADQGYLDAAQQLVTGDCSGGIATARNAIAVAARTDALKQTFVDDWNANVVGRYQDATTLASEAI